MCVKSKAANPSENRTPIYLTFYGKLSIKKKTNTVRPSHMCQIKKFLQCATYENC